MSKLTFNKELCKGCGLCVQACPKNVLAVSDKNSNGKGYYVVEAVNEKDCFACAFCATMCPDCVITVEK